MYLNHQNFNIPQTVITGRAYLSGMKRSLVRRATKREMPDIEDSWKTHIMHIREMRKSGDAPVDSMGCHKLADPLASPKTHRFQVLLALMLSSQTKDEITAGAMMRLRSHGCSVESMLDISTSNLESILHPVGFYKKKAVYIQKVAALLKDKYNGDIPNTVEGLCFLPGVGPKMAHLVMQIAWGRVEGIAVDTHVHRIVNRLGWMETDTPEKTRIKLQQILPESEWSTINPLLVGFGQQRCLPVKPKCGDCLCNRICPASTINKTADKPPV